MIRTAPPKAKTRPGKMQTDAGENADCRLQSADVLGIYVLAFHYRELTVNRTTDVSNMEIKSMRTNFPLSIQFMKRERGGGGGESSL